MPQRPSENLLHLRLLPVFNVIYIISDIARLADDMKDELKGTPSGAA